MEANVLEGQNLSENKTPETKEAEKQKVDNSAENTLINIAKIVLTCGIIANIICLFTLAFIEDPKAGYSYRTETVFNPSGFATTIMVLLSSLVSWGILKVLANISLTLKEINSKIR